MTKPKHETINSNSTYNAGNVEAIRENLRMLLMQVVKISYLNRKAIMHEDLNQKIKL